MGKHANSIGQRILREGTFADRVVTRQDAAKRIDKMVAEMPGERNARLMYIRNLVHRAVAGKIDKEEFKQFVRRVGCYEEVATMAPRARLVTRR